MLKPHVRAPSLEYSSHKTAWSSLPATSCLSCTTFNTECYTTTFNMNTACHYTSLLLPSLLGIYAYFYKPSGKSNLNHPKAGRAGLSSVFDTLCVFIHQLTSLYSQPVHQLTTSLTSFAQLETCFCQAMTRQKYQKPILNNLKPA